MVLQYQLRGTSNVNHDWEVFDVLHQQSIAKVRYEHQALELIQQLLRISNTSYYYDKYYSKR